MAAKNDIQDRISRYIDDAISMEEASITGLQDMVKEAVDGQDKNLFEEHLRETQRQKERLERRLEALGGKHSGLKDIVNKIGVAATDVLHAAKDPGDKETRNLVQAYSIENMEIAMYESLYAAASEVGDTETASLAKEIQAEEESAARKLFPRIAPVARRAVVNGAQT